MLLWRRRKARLPVIVGMATMPSRAATLGEALASVLPQADRLYLYLDGHPEVPVALLGEEKIVPVLSKDVPGLKVTGKFLVLTVETSDFIFVGCDDDIAYPSDYVSHSVEGLRRHRDRAVVGYHGAVLRQGLTSYRSGRTVFHFAEELRKPVTVDVLGTGTVAFSAARLRFDAGRWTHGKAADLCLAIEAGRAGIPLICLSRPPAYLRALEEDQPDSCYAALRKDDSVETMLAQQILERKHNPKAFAV